MGKDAQIRVAGAATQDNSVPAEVLVRALQGMQQSVWLLASYLEAREVKRRFKPDQALRQRFTVRLSVAEAGSYAIPMSLVDERLQPSLDSSVASKIFEKLTDVWAAVAINDSVGLRSAVSDHGYLERLLLEVKKMLPRRGEEWTLAFGVTGRDEVELLPRHRDTVDGWLETKPERREMSVIGDLLRIDFAGNRLWILYPPTGQEIECTYLEELEESIVLARRDMMQVTGQFVLDREGHPFRLMGVRSVEPVDLGGARFSEFEVNGTTYTLEPPIVFEPTLDLEEQQTFVATVSEFDFHLSGTTREELLQDFLEHMEFAWQEYVEVDEGDLTADAIQLRTTLLNRVKGP